jgi:hypothetical protein
MRVRAIASAACLVLAFGRPSRAYEVATHEDISRNAFDTSLMSGWSSVLEGYRTIQPGFEVRKKQAPVGWVRDGANDEDDWVSGQAFRFRNHFYNPLNDSGLSTYSRVLGHVTGIPSPTWGIGSCDGGACFEPFFQDVAGQDFSFSDARRYYYEALTAADPTDREHAWAKTFYTLGHVIHLIQDMAQPQHTRNDSHGPAALGLGGLSFYEKYTRDQGNSVGLPYANPSYAPVYRDADTSTFTAPFDFWHRFDGKGMADYSNRGFVSEHTNFCAADSPEACAGSAISLMTFEPYDILPHAGFPSPNGQAARVTTQHVENLPPPAYYRARAQGLHGEIDFITTPVHDAYTGATDWRRTSTYSLFDADLRQAGQQLTFTLNGYNFDDAHTLLIPRAVGYSAGLINYFFRGGFSVYATNAEQGQYEVRNETDEPMQGKFQVFYDDTQGNRYQAGTDQFIALAPAGQSGSTQPFPFTFGPCARSYTVVFHGVHGEESSGVATASATGVPGPFVRLSDALEATATDLGNDLASYQWGGSCFREFSGGTFLSCPLQLSNPSGALSGRQANVPGPGLPAELPTACAECCVSVRVTDSCGFSSPFPSYCFSIPSP